MLLGRRKVVAPKISEGLDVAMDGMLERLEGSFHAAVETPKGSVRQRRMELELIEPFVQARDLMRASLVDKRDRDRSQLAALVGESGSSRVARARRASQEIVKSDVRLPANVLLGFLAACETCEQVLNDRTSGDAKCGQWLEAMRGAAAHYLVRMRAMQKKQEELEESGLMVDSVLSAAEQDRTSDGTLEQAPARVMDRSDLATENGLLSELLGECPPSVSKHLATEMGLLSEFLGEYPPSLSETFRVKRQEGMLDRLLQCMPN